MQVNIPSVKTKTLKTLLLLDPSLKYFRIHGKGARIVYLSSGECWIGGYLVFNGGFRHAVTVLYISFGSQRIYFRIQYHFYFSILWPSQDITFRKNHQSYFAKKRQHISTFEWLNPWRVKEKSNKKETKKAICKKKNSSIQINGPFIQHKTATHDINWSHFWNIHRWWG